MGSMGSPQSLWLAITTAAKILGVTITVALVITLLNLTRRLFSDASLPSNLPWVGVGRYGNSPLGRARANLASFFHLRELLEEGYEKYSKIGQAYVLPCFITGPQVVLPPSRMPWLLAQSDEVLSQEHVNRQFLQAEHTFFDADRVADPMHPEVIRNHLTKRIGGMVDDVVDEFRAALDDLWGDGNTDEGEWREIQVYDTALLLTTRMAVRVLMGIPLCRDPKFLHICSHFIRMVALVAAAISIFPEFLRPIVAPIFTLPDYIMYRRCKQYLEPIIRERLRSNTPSAEKIPSEDPVPQDDFIQWCITSALTTTNPLELDPTVISARFAVLAFAAIQSSAITLTNALFDLASSPNCTSTLTSLRDEVVRETTTGWSKTSLARMTQVDSTLRESMRLGGFVERGVVKMVIREGGIVLPDDGQGDDIHLPSGVKVGISGYCVHRDERNYTDAMRFDALRFVRGAAAAAARNEKDEDEDGDGGRGRVVKRPENLINTSETFLGFSHGSHACPGRFFATNQLKIALAHITLLYDIEPIPTRPPNKWFFGHIAPPMTETLRVRRRRVCD